MHDSSSFFTQNWDKAKHVKNLKPAILFNLQQQVAAD
jgi:hypothetical protein